MAINDISLTAGMRQNLVSLQGTVDLLARTQSRLATGKKVNSALDNPTAFFTSQALDARANDIDSLKSDMGQAIQAIQAADKGIKGITSLIEQAKGIAQKAQGTTAGGAGLTQTLTLNSISAGAVITVGGLGFTEGTDFDISHGANSAAAELAVAINASAATVTASEVNGNVIKLWKADETDMVATDVEIGAGETGVTESGFIAGAGNDLAALQTSYNDVLTQIDALVDDSGYQGHNLLTVSTLDVKFESSTLSVSGFNAKTGGLGIAAASWAAPGDAAADVDLLDSALGTLRSNSASMAANLSIITTRQNFSTDMVNVLTEGSGKLTLADTNEEGANMLMLQTRQSLSTTALSLASQAAQSVLRLFG